MTTIVELKWISILNILLTTRNAKKLKFATNWQSRKRVRLCFDVLLFAPRSPYDDFFHSKWQLFYGMKISKNRVILTIWMWPRSDLKKQFISILVYFLEIFVWKFLEKRWLHIWADLIPMFYMSVLIITLKISTRWCLWPHFSRMYITRRPICEKKPRGRPRVRSHKRIWSGWR